MNDSAAYQQLRDRESLILAAMDQPNRIKRLEWLLDGHILLDAQSRDMFFDMLAFERRQLVANGESSHDC